MPFFVSIWQSEVDEQYKDIHNSGERVWPSEQKLKEKTARLLLKII